MAAATGLAVVVLAVGLSLSLSAPLPGSTVAAAEDPATSSGCDPLKDDKLSDLSSCIRDLLAALPVVGEFGELRRQGCCEVVRGGVASGESWVCELVRQAKSTPFFNTGAFEQVWRDISLKQHCVDISP